jgi:ATP-dependent RNA helicase DeaD
MSTEVHKIVTHYMKSPEKLKVQSYVDEAKLAQFYYPVDSRGKFSLLVHILKHEKPGLTIIFCGTRHRVDDIERDLYELGIKARALHGGLSQSRRKEAIDLFHNGKIDILVASDVAARGLDIKNV